ncbi:MAG: hypothetical protein SFV15_09730 [Polyangiaceae bacterium]|nr:hypothetical protein [Polyangiaceae bacterium]
MSQSLKLRLVSALAAVGVLFVTVHSAEASTLSVEWEPQPFCPPAAGWERRIPELLGQAAEGLLKEDLQAQVSFSAAPSGAIAVLITTRSATTSFERRLEAPDCAQALEAAALVVALAIDPLAVAETRARQPTGTMVPTAPLAPVSPPPPPPPYVAPVVPSFPVPVQNDAAPIRPKPTATPDPLLRAVHLELAPILDSGTLPKPRLGFGGALALSFSAFRAEAGMVWLPATSQAVPNSNGRVEASLTAAQARLSWFTGSKVHGAASLGFEAGEISAESFNVTTPATGSALWLAGLLGVRAELDLVPEVLALWVRPELLVPFARRGFTVEGPGRVYAPAAVSGRAALGLQLTF